MNRIPHPFVLLFFFLLSLLSVRAQAEQFDSGPAGIKLTIPDTWEFVPVVEKNKPREICAAQNKGGGDRFLSLAVFPSSGVEPQKELVADWAKNMAAAMGGKGEKVEIKTLRSIAWYSVHIIVPDVATMYVYSTFRNGMNYSISIVNRSAEDKTSRDEVNQIMGSVDLTLPSAVAAVYGGFGHLELDKVWGIAVPQGFILTDKVAPQRLAPWAYTLYSGLLAEGSADRVLVADDYFSQLICLSIKNGLAPMDTQVASLVSKVAARKFEADGSVYEELFAGAWDRSPQNVFLYRFRIGKANVRTTHYIFYVMKKDSTTMIKVQVPSTLEPMFEQNIYKMILASVKT